MQLPAENLATKAFARDLPCFSGSIAPKLPPKKVVASQAEETYGLDAFSAESRCFPVSG